VQRELESAVSNSKPLQAANRLSDDERPYSNTLEAVSMSGQVMEAIFKSGIPARDKLLSRVFGIFNEDIVRHRAATSRNGRD
jgi:hypothetical protein